MRNSRITTERIIAILQEDAAEAAPADLMRRHSISRQKFSRQKRQHGNLWVSEAKSLSALEEENAQLKRLVAERALNLQIMKDVPRKGS